MPSPLLRPMLARDTNEPHRASTPLELFFDLTFVVAVSLSAVGLAHEIESGHAARGVGVFCMIFFAIWWGWLNFTWFASAYDTDDWLYRIVTLVQMGGALTVAAGVPKVFEHDDFGVVVAGYVIMRMAMVFQWLRAARNDPPRRGTALRYVAGVTAVQVLWVARLALSTNLATASFLVLVLAELAVPVVSERRAVTTYHRAHVAERYGLFTIIVLGEGVLATGNSIIEALQVGDHVVQLVLLAGAGLVLVSGMWWLYFATESAETLEGRVRTFAWGYGHYGIFAAAAAVSSGIEVQVAAISHPEEFSDLAARLTVAIPAALFVLLVWSLILRPTISRTSDQVVVTGGLLAFAAAFVPLSAAWSTVLVAAVLAALVGYLVVRADEDATASVAASEPAPAAAPLPVDPAGRAD